MVDGTAKDLAEMCIGGCRYCAAVHTAMCRRTWALTAAPGSASVGPGDMRGGYGGETRDIDGCARLDRVRRRGHGFGPDQRADDYAPRSLRLRTGASAHPGDAALSLPDHVGALSDTRRV